MWQMRRNAATCAAMVAALFVCGALASPLAAADPLPVTSISPASGAKLPLPSGKIPFELVSSAALSEVFVDVSSRYLTL